MNVLVDVSCFMSVRFQSGTASMLGELLIRLLQDRRLNVMPIAYDEMSLSFSHLDTQRFREWITVRKDPLSWDSRLGPVAVDHLAPSDIFFDADIIGSGTWRRSDLYPRLKRSGTKIVSYVSDMSPFTNPEAQNPDVLIDFLYFFGAVLKFSDAIVAPAQGTLDEIASIQKEFGLRKTPGYEIRLGSWESVANRIAELLLSLSPSPLMSIVHGMRRRICGVDQPLVNADDESSGFVNQNLGSPVRFYLPCHDGISVNMSDFVWSNGQRSCLRFRMRGQFKALCLSADFSSFNGAQPTSLFANDVLVDRFVVQGRSKWLFSIPGSCIGADKTLVLRFEFEKASIPDEVIHNGDKRRIALRFIDMRFFAAEDYYLCKRAECLSFAEDDGAQALWYCARGLSHAENLFAWTCDDVVIMRFFFTAAEGMPHSVTLHYNTFLPEEHVEILVGDRKIATFVAQGEEERTFDWSADDVSTEGFLTLTLHLPDAISPKELGMGNDGRRLALQLFSVRLD